MKVKLENPSVFSKAVDVISGLVTEVRIKINDVGLSIVAMDPANVSMAGFWIPKTAFSVFEAGEEILGVNLDDLKRILRRCSSNSSLVLEKKENVLAIQILDKIQRNFTLSLIEVESEDKDMPSLEFSAKIEIDSKDLIDSVEDCLVVADACSFQIKDGKFVVHASGLNSAKSEFSSDEAFISAEDCKSKYSLEYLQKFLKGAKLVEKSVLRFAEDHPLRLDFKSPEMELSFILAPRVETED